MTNKKKKDNKLEEELGTWFWSVEPQDLIKATLCLILSMFILSGQYTLDNHPKPTDDETDHESYSYYVFIVLVSSIMIVAILLLFSINGYMFLGAGTILLGAMIKIPELFIGGAGILVGASLGALFRKIEKGEKK